MKLIVNLEPLAPPLTGVGIYTREILLRIVDADDVHEVLFFMGHRPLTREDGLALIKEGMRPTKGPKPRPIISLIRKYCPQLLWALSHWLFWWRTRQFTDHVYLELNNIARPFTGKTVLVVHDLSHIHYPEHHPEERLRYFSHHFDKSIRQAARIVCVSDAIARETSQRYNLDDLPAVVSPACSDAFREMPNEACQPTKEKYNLPDRYILSVGSIEPRKNLQGLLDAFEQVPEFIRNEYPLVIVGASGWQNERLKKRISSLTHKRQVLSLGYVSDDDLPALYNLATIFVYVSFYEGFGIPVIEAMSCGTPVIISQDPALRETAGGAAFEVNAADSNALKDVMMELAQDAPARQQLIDSGLARATVFSWETSTANLVRVVEECSR